MNKTGREERRAARRKEILLAASEVLAEKGYSGTTMLDVAARANASKETLYAWFGSKQGLFESLVEWGAGRVSRSLDERLHPDGPVLDVLSGFCRALLRLLLGENSVLINRAAMAEAGRSGEQGAELGRLLAAKGRDTVLPRLEAFLVKRRDSGELDLADTREAAETLLGLTLADLQVRRLLGVIPMPGEPEVRRRADRAARQFMILHGNKAG